MYVSRSIASSRARFLRMSGDSSASALAAFLAWVDIECSVLVWYVSLNLAISETSPPNASAPVVRFLFELELAGVDDVSAEYLHLLVLDPALEDTTGEDD